LTLIGIYWGVAFQSGFAYIRGNISPYKYVPLGLSLIHCDCFFFFLFSFSSIPFDFHPGFSREGLVSTVYR
jgi:hypothetical protein